MKKRIICLSTLLVLFLIGSIGTSFAMPDGAVSQGNISVFKNGKLSKNLSGTSPVEDGSLLVCNGKCMIKSNGVSILAEDQAELAITNNKDGLFNLFVRRGHVEFIFSDSAKRIAFHTPEGVYSVADVMFNASTDSVVRGYMLVDDSGSKVGVREGRMIFATAGGAKSVKANEHIILAMSDVKKKKEVMKKAAAIIPAAEGSATATTAGGAESGGTFLGMTKSTAIAAGTVVTAAAVGFSISASNSSGGTISPDQ